MLKPRPHQREAVDAVFAEWMTGTSMASLVVVATGGGKSMIAATTIQESIQSYPGMRIVVVTHVAELIEQGYKELLAVWPFAPAGIFSAGLGRRDSQSQILYAGIQTVWNKSDLIGHVDLLIVDEAHLIPTNANTMYGKFIAALRDTNPEMRILGLTATPFRLDSGRLDEGDDRLFDRVVYEYGIRQGIDDGYLAPLTSKGTETSFDMTGVHRLGGDYKQSEMQAAVDREEIYEAAVKEIIAKGQSRRSWLIFGAGVENALHIRDAIRKHGITCETITGETPREERRRIIEDFKAYRIRALTNNSVLTTGFDHKGVDLIAAMRPTLSASLYLQMMGRGTRPLYAPGTDMSTVEGRLAGIANGPKPNCLVLDFAGLVSRHGPVDMVQPTKPGKGDGEAPVKLCPECDELVHISVMKCPCCGYEFPPSENVEITAKADTTPVLSTEKPWYAVTAREFAPHPAKVEGNPPSVKVTYTVDGKKRSEWICPQHMEHPVEKSRRFPKAKADRYWSAHQGKLPFPRTVSEFLHRAGELLATTEVQLDFSKSSKYPEIIGHRAGEATYATEVEVRGSGNLGVVLGKKEHVGAERVRLRALAAELDEVPF